MVRCDSNGVPGSQRGHSGPYQFVYVRRSVAGAVRSLQKDVSARCGGAI